MSGVFPRAKHSYCAYHIEKNLKRNHHTRLKGLVFKAAKATTPREFEETLQEMKTLNAEAGNYIKGIEKERWARAFFPAPRFGHVTSNISESMNHWLEEARHKDPVALFSTYIRHLNQLFETRREEYQSMNQTDLPQTVAEIFNKSLDDSRKLLVLRNTHTVFEVQRKNEPDLFRVVKLDPPSCSCGFFWEYGVPCRHLCAAMLSIKENPYRLIVRERLLSSLRETYVGVTVPIDLSTLDNDGLRAVTREKKRGRPKEKRYRSATEKGRRKR